MACLVQNSSTNSTAHLPVHENLSKKRKLASPNHFKNKRVQRIHDTSTSPPWTPLYPNSRLEQEAIQYIHKFYCKDCQMDQQAAERAKAAAANAMDDSGASGEGACSGTDIKQEPLSPMSPQQTTDEASLMVTLDKNKESLKRKLMMRRSLNELVDQGIYPSPKTPLAFMEQKKSLERAKIGDSLRFKISHRPDRQQLVQQHILEDTTIDPSLHERQRQLKKARLADSLNDKLSHRPGVLELVQGNIIQTDGKLHQLIKEGSLSFDKAADGDEFSYMCEDSKSSDEGFSPDQTDDSNLSDISSPPVIPPAPELPTSFTKALSFSPQIQFGQDSKVTLPQTTQPFSIPQQTANSSGITITAGAFAAGNFVAPRNNVTVSTINNNKSRPKKPKPKPQPKAKVIKFHEYKGPPNIVKSTQPVSTSSIAAVGLGNPTGAAQTGSQSQQGATKAAPQETPYHILLQQQQLFLQWQLEFSQKNLNATVIVPTQKDGQPALQTMTSNSSSIGNSGSTTGNIESSTPVSVITQTSPQTVFTVTPTNQNQSAAQVQQIRISSPVMTQVKQEPPLGQPQPQMNPNVTPITNTSKPVKRPTPTVSTAPPKQYTSLEEMKVPELKAELKKRNLTVSGAKPQLIERLKPYADAIIKAPKDRSPAGSVTSPGSSVLSPPSSVLSSRTGTSPQSFGVMSPPNSAPSPQSVLMSPKGIVIPASGSVLGASSSGATMTLPVVLSSSGTFSQPGSVQSSISSLKSPGSVNSSSSPAVTSPPAVGSVLSRPGSVMSPVGSVIDEILCSNAESPLPSIQSMQSAVSVSNMTMIPDDLSNPFSPPESPLVMENVMSPDPMEVPIPSPANEGANTAHHTNQFQQNQIQNIPTSMEQSRPPSVLSVVQSEVDKLDMPMDIDLDLNQSLSSSLAPALNSVTLGTQQPQSPEQGVVGLSQTNILSQAAIQSDVFKSQQDDQQQMLNHIEAQLRILQEKQQQKQQMSTTSPFQLSQEELLRQQQEKIEKLQAQLQESQLQLQLQQLQHQQLQQQQQKLQLLQQQQLQLQQQQQQSNQQQQKMAGVPQVAPVTPSLQVQPVAQTGQAGQVVQQPLHGQPEIQQPPPQGQPPVQMQPQQVQVTVQQPAVLNSQTQRQITVQVPRSSAPAQVPTTSPTNVHAPQSTVTMQKPTAKQQSKPNQTTTPQVIFSVPNGVKAPTLGNLPPNMKQIQIPASWLTNIQSTPQGMSAVIMPQAKKAKPPSLEFIKNQAINQTLNLVGNKSLIAVSTSTGGQPQLIIAAAPSSKTNTVEQSTSSPSTAVNGLTKPVGQKMTGSLPASPVDGGKSSVTRTASNPFFVPTKDPPKYDEAVRNKQSKTPDAGTGENLEKSQTMDDVLEILIRTGELPASAAEEPPPTPRTTSQSPTVPTMSLSHSSIMSAPSMTIQNQSVMSATMSTTSSSVGPDTEMKGNIDSVYSPYEEMRKSLSPLVKTEVKSEPSEGQVTVTVCPPADNSNDSNDLFDFNDVINSDLNSMDWTSDQAFGDLDLTDTSGINTGMDLTPTEQGLLSIPAVQSPQRSNHGSEPDLTNLGLVDMDTNSNMQIDVPDWLDVIMPSTGFTPVSANAPVSFPADPILTPQTQKEVLDLFNFDESDLNTPSDLTYGSAWDKLTETTSG